MNYWQGYMNWPITKGWRCETCGRSSMLIWGMVHGVCRCDNCHTQYGMRDAEGDRVLTPISRLKEAFREPARIAWETSESPVDTLTIEQWVEFGVPEEEFVPEGEDA